MAAQLFRRQVSGLVMRMCASAQICEASFVRSPLVSLARELPGFPGSGSGQQAGVSNGAWENNRFSVAGNRRMRRIYYSPELFDLDRWNCSTAGAEPSFASVLASGWQAKALEQAQREAETKRRRN
jgi:hypothetical protein